MGIKPQNVLIKISNRVGMSIRAPSNFAFWGVRYHVIVNILVLVELRIVLIFVFSIEKSPMRPIL